ncbi:MAG: type III secretion system ATPase SctN [Pseudomonadota bacterium]
MTEAAQPIANTAKIVSSDDSSEKNSVVQNSDLQHSVLKSSNFQNIESEEKDSQPIFKTDSEAVFENQKVESSTTDTSNLTNTLNPTAAKFRNPISSFSTLRNFKTNRNVEEKLDQLNQSLFQLGQREVFGRVTRVLGTVVQASVPGVCVGELCELFHRDGSRPSRSAEVVALDGDHAILTPLGDVQGISTSTLVRPTGRVHQLQVSDALLGRVLDGLGKPIDGLGPVEGGDFYSVLNAAPNPMQRSFIDAPLPLGVKVIDTMLTCGIGQRLGIFAAAGVGKSTLLAMLARYADVDVTVIGLVGERGREVREFLRELGPDALKRAVVVVATSDRSPTERVKSAQVATTIAEYFRDKGQKVLLLMDSVTRYARAQREIGLAAGEPPTRRGFPPSVFAELPKLLERSGCGSTGSITALYTVLVEGDDMSEPVADEVRSILDGHIVLSRKLAGANHYPAVDILQSASRVMPAVVDAKHLKAAARYRELLASYQDVELLVKIGEYQAGSDPIADEAIKKMQAMQQLVRQNFEDHIGFEDSVNQLKRLVGD